MDYLHDPAEIYRRSFAAIEAEADLTPFSGDLRRLALRLIHASGRVALLSDLAYSADVAASARAALLKGAPIFVDCRMAAAGVMQRRLPAANRIICTLCDEHVEDIAKAQRTTRSAAAVELWREQLGGAVVAIGNAPTALFRLLELLDEGAPRPAAIFAFPPGFVGAAEAKAELAANPRGVPFMTLHGRQGGSPLAAAAINALLVDHD